MDYSFDKDDAVEYGVNCAVIIKNIRFWILKNQANRKHFYEGRFWTYNSVKAFEELFPFWKKHQIRHILDQLEDKGVVIKGNFNKQGYDRTNWYTLAEFPICDISQMELRDIANGNEESRKPIPDSKPDNKPDGKGAKKNVEEKHQLAEDVYLTIPELEKLQDDYGINEVCWMIDKLNNYKLQQGKKYKSDYRAMLNWVVPEAVKHFGIKQNKPQVARKLIGYHNTTDFKTNEPIRVPVYEGDKQPRFGFEPLP